MKAGRKTEKLVPQRLKLPELKPVNETHIGQILDYLDDNFNIADDGVNSEIEGLDEEDFDEENDLLPEVAVSEDEDDEDVDLAALDIEENGF